MATEGNQPAFPFIAGDQSNPDDRAICEGMSKREYFAAIAMSIYGSHSSYYTGSPEALAKASVQMADALIAELNKT